MGGICSGAQRAHWLPVEVDAVRPWQEVWTSSPLARRIARGNRDLESLLDTLFRSAFAAGALALLLQSIIFNAGEGPKYLQYLTNLSLLLGCAGSLFGFAVHLCVRFMPRRSDEKTTKQPWDAATVWVLKTVGLDVTFFTFLLFWVLEYSPNQYKTSHSLYVTALCHGGVWACLLLEWIFATKLPFRVQHGIYSVGWGVVHSIVTLIHYGVTGGQIYLSLDWRSAPGLAAGLSLFICFVGIPIVHMGHFGLLCLTRWALNRPSACKETEVCEEVNEGGDGKQGKPRSTSAANTAATDIEALRSSDAVDRGTLRGEPLPTVLITPPPDDTQSPSEQEDDGEEEEQEDNGRDGKEGKYAEAV
uniref:Uncharacterized protein n=1 Tax=Chromera velia CCMP2878 TaxID=1169474 RepID=A0A0G4HAY2_9ALVE|eukprot:Cvel_6151.t1-p1 / transcript=Cvel_6151.t1 / gene=Cvel_6151 / organism=Chromera_velia_CCMP2878 / gene_product=hypothetical protein / transcript_product=hypothetical protein / location=Cvel_scaffold297:76939-80635(+) / protein_length=359 / sequence_SO=supercontig / SO=protein_coding / is_pseudo=false